MRLYTLRSRGSRELKTFLEIRLISSRIDQKLKNKGRIHGFLKGKISPRIVADWCSRGGGLMASRGRFRGHRSWLQFRDELLVCWLQFCFNRSFKRSHDHAWSWSRSSSDRASIVVVSLAFFSWNHALRSWHWIHDERATIAAQSRRDRGLIGPRSWSSSANRLNRLIELQVSERSRSRDRVGCDREERPPPAVRSVRIAMKISTVWWSHIRWILAKTAMKIGRSSWRHVAIDKLSDRGHLR